MHPQVVELLVARRAACDVAKSFYFSYESSQNEPRGRETPRIAAVNDLTSDSNRQHTPQVSYPVAKIQIRCKFSLVGIINLISQNVMF